MLDKPQNYQEAKTILQTLVESDYEQHKYKVSKWCAILVPVVGLGIAVGIGVIKKDIGLGIMALAITIAISYRYIVNYYVRYRTFKDIRSGDYFKDKSERRVIDIVSKSVDQYNDHLRWGKK